LIFCKIQGCNSRDFRGLYEFVGAVGSIRSARIGPMTDLAKLVKELSDLNVLEAVELAKRLEMKWDQPTAGRSKSRKSNEGPACEAIVRRLEERANGVRADLV
jgi:hypothetical protein